MSLDYSNERYVRIYTRDTTTWKLLDWKGRTVMLHALRRADRAGVLDVGGRGVRGLTTLLELPIEIVADGLAQLLEEECIVERGPVYVFPRYIEAQEAVQTTAHRSREYRERRRALALGEPEPEPEPVTKRDAGITKRDANVTRRHAASRGVTPDLADPIRSEREREASPGPEREHGPEEPPRLSLVKPSAWIPEWTGALADARELAQARGVDVEASVVAFTAFADGKRWPDAERASRLAAWLTRERNADPKRARPKPRPPDPPPVTCEPMTDEERAEFRDLAQRLAVTPNLDALAEAERKREAS